MLTRHNLLVKVKEEVKMKETIQAFINEETESQIATAEIIYGFQKCITPCQKNDGNTMLFGSDESYKKNKKNRKFGICRYDHRIWQCSTFKNSVSMIGKQLPLKIM